MPRSSTFEELLIDMGVPPDQWEQYHRNANAQKRSIDSGQPQPVFSHEDPSQIVGYYKNGWYQDAATGEWQQVGAVTNVPNGPSPKTLAANALTSLQTDAVRYGDPIPRRIGRSLITPRVIAAKDHNGQLAVDLLIGRGEIQEIEYFQDSAGENIGIPTGTEEFLGTSGQSASTLMTAAYGSYDALPDIAHVTLPIDPASGQLNYKIMIKGEKIPDIRLSPVSDVYTDNPGLWAHAMFTEGGYTCDAASFSALATYCEETVGTDDRWRITGTVENQNDVLEWARTFSQYCGHAIFDIQGDTVFAVVPESRSVSHTITDADELGTSVRVRTLGQRESVNKVIVHYRDENLTERTAESAATANAGEISRLRMPLWASYTMARRFAQITYNRFQSDVRYEVERFDAALARSLGDLGEITSTRMGLAAFEAELIEHVPIGPGRWRSVYSEYDAAFFSDTVYSEPSWNDTSLGNPNNPPDGPTPTLTEQLYTDGTTYSRFKVEFTGVSWGFAQGYQVTVTGEQQVLNAVIAHEGATTHTVYTAALKTGVLYTASVKVLSKTGALSDTAGTAQATAQGKNLPPGDVDQFTEAYEADQLVSLAWTEAEEITGDLAGYIVKRLPQADWTGTAADWTHTNAVTLHERVDAERFLTPTQAPGTYYFGVKAKDIHGNQSTNATWVQVVVTANASSNNSAQVRAGTTVNMRVFVWVDSEYAVTDNGDTWETIAPNASPLPTWEDTWSASPTQTWEDLQATDSSFESLPFDIGTSRSGTFGFSDTGVTVHGGTRQNATLVGSDTSPIVYTSQTGNSVSASGRYVKAKVSTIDSPASAGDGLMIKLPILVSFSGQALTENGSVTIAAASPLDNPKAVTFTLAFPTAPHVMATPTGSGNKIASVDNVTTTGFDLYLRDPSTGAKVDGSANWTAEEQ